MASAGGSISNALLTALNPHPFRKYVNYLGKEDGMSHSDFESSSLSEYYELDLSMCHIGKRLNANMLYEIFGSYSGQDGKTVRMLMLDEVTKNPGNLGYYECAGFICLTMKNLTLEEWLEQQVKSTVRGDEMSVYVLSHLFMRHTMIHTKNRAWCSILPSGNRINYAMACQTHLLYLGNDIFGVLRLKPPPVPMSPSVVNQPDLPDEDIRTNALHIDSSRPFNIAMAGPNSTLSVPPETRTEPLVVSTHSKKTLDTNSNNSQAAETSNFDETSNDSNVNIPTPERHVTKVSAEGILNRDCRVNITPLSEEDLQKYLSKSSSSPSEDSDKTILNTDQSSFASSDDNIPLSDLFNQDRGRPRRRTKRITYEESSPGSASDSDYDAKPPKQPRIGPGSGPSLSRIQAQAMMKKLTAKNTSAVSAQLTGRHRSTPKPVSNIKPSAGKKGASQDMNGKNNQTPVSNASTTIDDSKSLKGNLRVSHHGIIKCKKIRKFRCKICDILVNSCKEANDHHKKYHGKCFCSKCGKQCNTLSTLDRHMYTHWEDKKHICRTCGEAFTFEGEWKQHRFKHCRVAMFPCTHCIKRFKREGELVKHLKVHENKTYSCSSCKYTTQDPRNLKQHEKVHTDDLPYLCTVCNHVFKHWMQRKRHECVPMKRLSSPEFD